MSMDLLQSWNAACLNNIAEEVLQKYWKWEADSGTQNDFTAFILNEMYSRDKITISETYQHVLYQYVGLRMQLSD